MKQHNDITKKPYYRCLICPRFRNACGGRPTRDMDLLTWCEYICDVMDFFNISNAYVAEKGNVSTKTVEKIRARNTTQDIMRSTSRCIEQVVLGPVGEHTCYLDTDSNAERVARLLSEIESLHREKERLEKIIDKYLAN